MKDFNGIDLSALSHDLPTPRVMPKIVPGRVCHIDADFLAYQVAYDDEKGLDDMQHNCDEITLKLRLMAGAEYAKLHLTPRGDSESDPLYKGGRYQAALLKEYQGNRKDKPKPKFLHIMREWMHKERKATMHMDIEADDGMSIAQYAAIANGESNLSIIATKDKDLTMVPGLMLDWDTGEISDTEDKPFGWIMLDESKSTKKIRGRGWKYFWAQMLTGDPADNISGLPKVCDAKYLKGLPKACGPVMAYSILEPVTNNKDAFNLVKDLYKACGKYQGFVNYRDGKDVPFGNAFQSEAQLLWMRRQHSIKDALLWMQEYCL